MKKIHLIILAIVVLALGSFQLKTTGYVVGSRVENFTLYDLTADSTFTLNTYVNKKAVVIIFDANYCAYSQRYRSRIAQLNRSFQNQGVQFVLVNSNKVKQAPKESNAEMRKLIKEEQIQFPYLVDGKSRIANVFGARKNPECFVLTVKNGVFYVAYHGAIDDNAQVESEVSKSYLKDALIDILNYRTPSIKETPSVGCMIRK